MTKYCEMTGCISRAMKKAKPREWIKEEWDLCKFHYARATGKEEERPTIYLFPGKEYIVSKSSELDRLEKNLKIAKKEIMWMVANITPVSQKLAEALGTCEYLITKLKSGQVG